MYTLLRPMIDVSYEQHTLEIVGRHGHAPATPISK